MESIFIDKNKMPDNNDMLLALGDSYQLWQMIKDYVFTKYPQAKELWSCSKYGRGIRINIKSDSQINDIKELGSFLGITGMLFNILAMILSNRHDAKNQDT
jgi:hypothetical protein